jgi:pilus assembly protein CpaC
MHRPEESPKRKRGNRARPGALRAGVFVLLLAILAPYARGQLCSPEPRPLIVLLNSTVRLQMASKKPIRTVTNPKEGVLSIRTVERDPTTIVLIGTAPGITRLELEDADGGKEIREVAVQADVEYLTAQLRKAIPLGQINVIPNGTKAAILTGYVQRAEDTIVAQAVAHSMGFDTITALRLNGVQQVQLDVVVALVRRSKGRNFGFNFLINGKHPIFGSTVGNLIPISGNPVGLPSSTLEPTVLGTQIINAAPGTTNIFGGIINNHSGFLGFLQALENEGLVKLMAQPRVVTLSGNPASFLNGGEQAVPVPAGLGQVGVQFEEFGTRLNVLPIVLGNGRIHLEVEPEVSVLDPNAGTTISGASVAGRATQRIHTTVEMETGQTFVIGGLISKAVQASAVKVPVIGQLPFIGALFSTKSHTEDEEELVVMVTPHLVDAQSADQVVKVLPGEETRSPDDFELFLEGILEAPRGPRAVFHGNRYVPAHKNGPTANLFPCAGLGDGYKGLNGHGGGAHGSKCSTGCAVPVAAPAVISPAAPVQGPTGPAGNPPADAGTSSEVKQSQATPPAALPALPGGPNGSEIPAVTPKSVSEVTQPEGGAPMTAPPPAAQPVEGTQPQSQNMPTGDAPAAPASPTGGPDKP